MLPILTVLAAAAYASLATWLARAAGARWVWLACAVFVLGVAAAGATRVGTSNPYSRTSRWDPLLFFLMAAAVLGAAAAASSQVALSLASPSRGPLAAAAWSAGAFLLALPVGFVLAVAIEVLWPH